MKSPSSFGRAFCFSIITSYVFIFDEHFTGYKNSYGFAFHLHDKR